MNTGNELRALKRVAKTSCDMCKGTNQPCFVGEDGAQCATCAESGKSAAFCGVNVDEYWEMDVILKAQGIDTESSVCTKRTNETVIKKRK